MIVQIPTGCHLDIHPGTYRGIMPDGRAGYFNTEEEYLSAFAYELAVLQAEQRRRKEVTDDELL